MAFYESGMVQVTELFSMILADVELTVNVAKLMLDAKMLHSHIRLLLTC